MDKEKGQKDGCLCLVKRTLRTKRKKIMDELQPLYLHDTDVVRCMAQIHGTRCYCAHLNFGAAEDGPSECEPPNRGHFEMP